MVFVKAVHEAKHLSNLELEIYDSWFNPTIARSPELVPDGFVYLKTDPKTCQRRMRQRNRGEECSVAPSYLEMLSKFHDSWLIEGSRKLELPNGSSAMGLMLGDRRRTTSTLCPAGAIPLPKPQLVSCPRAVCRPCPGGACVPPATGHNHHNLSGLHRICQKLCNRLLCQ
jgi:hypothetical protein